MKLPDYDRNTIARAVAIIAKEGRDAMDAIVEMVVAGEITGDDYEEACEQLEAAAEYINDANAKD